ncbi:MAG: o-succinylbenzoate synthase [Actinomycetota bacterium]|nr:o-succinylbenzoate synthase [Actinomycetota bacterium]
MLDLILDSLRVVALSTKTNFRSVTSREVALFQGPYGWAEFSPFVEYSDRESVPWLVSAIEAAFVEPLPLLREVVSINATLPAVDGPRQIAEILDLFSGARVVKIKVGGSLADDLARIANVRQLRPDAAIRIDVNGLWSVDQAEDFLNQVGEIEYVEQPCATIDELRELKRRIRIKIVGDEIIRKADDPFAVNLEGAIDILMLKVAPLGGIRRALEIANYHKIPIAVSSALESAVGISHGLRLAAIAPELNYASGLGTGALLAQDVAELPIINGEIQVKDIAPDRQALKNFAVSSQRLNWWVNRIRMTWNAGANTMISERGWDR